MTKMRKVVNKKPLKYSDLAVEKENCGRLVFACVGNFQGKGKRKLILHNVALSVDEEGNPYYSYGDGNVLAVTATGIVNSKTASK